MSATWLDELVPIAVREEGAAILAAMRANPRELPKERIAAHLAEDTRLVNQAGEALAAVGIAEPLLAMRADDGLGYLISGLTRACEVADLLEELGDDGEAEVVDEERLARLEAAVGELRAMAAEAMSRLGAVSGN